jgi:magnesium chelatase family protein
MLAKIYSAAVYGVDAYEVEIEVNASGGHPVIVVVGLPDAAVKESRDRVTTAVSNSGYFWPRGRTTINLAPADIKKGRPKFRSAHRAGNDRRERGDRHFHFREIQFRG